MPYYRCPACGLTTYSAASYSSASACSACLEALPDDAELHLGLALPKIIREQLAVLVAGGRGIVIVAGLLEKWRADSTGDGCVARCQVAVEQQPVAAVDDDKAAGSGAGPASELAEVVHAHVHTVAL